MKEYEVTQLDITGYDAPVPNEYWRTGSDTLVVMLPGAGYTNQMPLMFYIQELAMSRGWDILQVNYDYSRLPNDTSKDELFQRLRQDVRSALATTISAGNYSELILAGKSLGTIAMTTLVPVGVDVQVKWLWLTPLSRRSEVRQAMSDTAARAAVVIGTRDDHYDAAFLEELQGKGAMVEVVDNGDHSLDIEGDVDASIAVLRDVIRALDGYLGR